jgi:hypothetical protein
MNNLVTYTESMTTLIILNILINFNETWCLALWDEDEPKIFEKKVTSNIFRRKRRVEMT